VTEKALFTWQWPQQAKKWSTGKCIVFIPGLCQMNNNNNDNNNNNNIKTNILSLTYFSQKHHSFYDNGHVKGEVN
jgi:hypothetical protein